MALRGVRNKIHGEKRYGIIGYIILGLERDNGKENGNYRDYIGVSCAC